MEAIFEPSPSYHCQMTAWDAHENLYLNPWGHHTSYSKPEATQNSSPTQSLEATAIDYSPISSEETPTHFNITASRPLMSSNGHTATITPHEGGLIKTKRKSHSVLLSGAGHFCDECGKTYQRERDLNRHLKTHERPFTCKFDYCDRRFALNKDCRRHEEEVHRTKEAMECYAKYDCKFKSTREDTLRRHMKNVHSIHVARPGDEWYH